MAKQQPKRRHQLPKTVVPLLTRTIVFLVAFLLLSGTLGPKIISHSLVNKDGFQVYGGSGKALLFGIVALGILVKRRGLETKLPTWRKSNITWFALAALSFLIAWHSIDQLIAGNTSAWWVTWAHLGLLSSVLFVAIGAFGLASSKLLLRTYKRELFIAVGLSIAFYAFLYAVYGLWTVLAAGVLHSVRWLLSGVGLHSTVLPPRTLVFNKFAINVAQYCSGIESIALFTALYVLIGVLDWPRFNHKRYLLVFLPALLLLFGFNILRVAILILGGYYINPHIAFSLFHTYAGMIFFILYSLIFWAVSYAWLLAKNRRD